jgi:hypothetical protein
MGWSAALRYNSVGSKLGGDIQRRIINSMYVHTIGIDLEKTIFHLVGLDQPGNVALKRRPSRSQLLRQLANTRSASFNGAAKGQTAGCDTEW